MRLFAVTVNFFFFFPTLAGGPNCLILLTISLGRRTIANRRDAWQGERRNFFGRCHSSQAIAYSDSCV
ncbi:MAG: hypothetical protein JWR65_1225 [Massilia sp.]|nr:hypothetical protein [Massilia sp.]